LTGTFFKKFKLSPARNNLKVLKNVPR